MTSPLALITQWCPSSDCKKPGFDTGWPVIFRCQHHCNNLLLQIQTPLFLTKEAAHWSLALVQALVISRLDYCDSLLAVEPACACICRSNGSGSSYIQDNWSNLTTQPIHYVLLLPISLLLPHYKWDIVTVQQNHKCLLTWLHNDGRNWIDIRKVETLHFSSATQHFWPYALH